MQLQDALVSAGNESLALGRNGTRLQHSQHVELFVLLTDLCVGFGLMIYQVGDLCVGSIAAVVGALLFGASSCAGGDCSVVAEEVPCRRIRGFQRCSDGSLLDAMGKRINRDHVAELERCPIEADKRFSAVALEFDDVDGAVAGRIENRFERSVWKAGLHDWTGPCAGEFRERNTLGLATASAIAATKDGRAACGSYEYRYRDRADSGPEQHDAPLISSDRLSLRRGQLGLRARIGQSQCLKKPSN